ncbi:hypothetical protein [Mucilaginibacter lappiensis]|uniref:Uncharacterized protein n=1 Tax=Mucilaginibacter lappiensis TaxID=354630 RepID=A0A841JKI0_9SPHI|nr:hypothetical protein [Mucilaginibacter lappiensis]MBB6131510.1 hypothetical protein [Mucilaginibacter lappiensis]
MKKMILLGFMMLSFFTVVNAQTKKPLTNEQAQELKEERAKDLKYKHYKDSLNAHLKKIDKTYLTQHKRDSAMSADIMKRYKPMRQGNRPTKQDSLRLHLKKDTSQIKPQDQH